MKVKELVELLRDQDPEAHVHFMGEVDVHPGYEVESLYSGTTTWGILNPKPRTVPVVVLTP